MQERSSRSGMASPTPLDSYKSTLSPPLTFVSRPLSFYYTRQLTNGLLPSSPSCSLAPVSGAPTRQPRATSRPFQSPFCLRLTHHIPFDHLSARCRVGGLQLTGDHDSVPEPFQSAPRLPTRFPLDRHHPSLIATYHQSPPTFLPTYIFEDATPALSILPPLHISPCPYPQRLVGSPNSLCNCNERWPIEENSAG